MNDKKIPDKNNQQNSSVKQSDINQASVNQLAANQPSDDIYFLDKPSVTDNNTALDTVLDTASNNLSSKKKRVTKQAPHKKSSSDNWYARLHPIGKEQVETTKHRKRRKLLNLSLFFRVWVAVGIIIVISGIVIFQQLFNYVRPITQQVIEDTLVDTSKLLSASLQSALESGDIYNDRYQAMLDTAFSTPSLPSKQGPYVNKNQLDVLGTWYHRKTHSSFRVYVTDSRGIVIYDSQLYNSEGGDYTNAEGRDYSRWRDVYLTLRGQYGARTTHKNPDDPTSAIMYVAQPIYDSHTADKKIIGVVSVGKPTATIVPYLNATRQRMLTTSGIIGIVTLLMAGLIAWWLKQSMMLVSRYTQSLAQDTKKPYFYLGRELNDLTATIEDMKHRLENRAYVTDYVHTLTHELKSPLTAIRASGELLEEHDLDEEDRLMLSQSITEQSIKLQTLIDKLLLLAKIEQPTFKLTMQAIDPDALLQTLIRNCEMQRQYQQVAINYECKIAEDTESLLYADSFWLEQALQNVLDNAIYFAHTTVDITLNRQIKDKETWVEIIVFNDGDLIPDYALSKLFDRYFSLSHQHIKPTQREKQSEHQGRQSQGKKGTGLGLTLVKQVIERHGGVIYIDNIESNESTAQKPSGVQVTIYLPAYLPEYLTTKQ